MDDLIRRLEDAQVRYVLIGGPGLPRFEDAERDAVVHETENGTRVRCMSGKCLLEAKRASNRPRDADDILFLEAKLAAAEGRKNDPDTRTRTDGKRS